jgi:hypothetical protein
MEMRIWGACALLLVASGVCAGQNIPRVKTKALDESEVVLPKPGSRQVVILILGFSHKGGEVCGVWNKKVAADYGEDEGVLYYGVPVLQDAPSFVRPMIVHGMKKGATAKELAHMAPVYADEDAWKKLVGYSASDDAYLLVSDASGKVLWQGHGPYTDGMFAELKKAVEGLKEKERH